MATRPRRRNDYFTQTTVACVVVTPPDVSETAAEPAGIDDGTVTCISSTPETSFGVEPAGPEVAAVPPILTLTGAKGT